MAIKYINGDVQNNGLVGGVKNVVIRMLLIKTYALGDSYATVVGNILASATLASTDQIITGSDTNPLVLTTASGKSGTASASSTQYANGTATAGSVTTLTDSAASWTTNAFANKALYIVSGTGAGQYARITSNTGTVLTFPTLATAPDNTSVYRVVDDLHIAFTDNTSKVLWVTEETSKQVITSGNTVNFPQLTLTINQPT